MANGFKSCGGSRRCLFDSKAVPHVIAGKWGQNQASGRVHSSSGGVQLKNQKMNSN